MIKGQYWFLVHFFVIITKNFVNFVALVLIHDPMEGIIERVNYAPDDEKSMMNEKAFIEQDNKS